MSYTALRLSSAMLALAVFLVDVLTPLEGAIAVLYVVAILLAAKTTRRNDIIIAACGCVALTIAAYLLSHDLGAVASPALRALVSLAAIAITTLLSLQNQAATKHLATMIDVSQALSGEIVLEKLIDKLMRAAIQHAGAERGLLIVPQGDELQIDAEATAKRK